MSASYTCTMALSPFSMLFGTVFTKLLNEHVLQVFLNTHQVQGTIWGSVLPVRLFAGFVAGVSLIISSAPLWFPH